MLLHEEARRLSVTDGLTGLANYRGFTVTVGKEVERAVALRAARWRCCCSTSTTSSSSTTSGATSAATPCSSSSPPGSAAQVRDVDTLARYGGEEFVVVLPETDRAGAVQAAERICAAVRRRPFGEDGEQPIDVTLSIGIAVFPDHGTSSTALLRRADEALYAAKRGGRDGWRLASGRAGGETPAAGRRSVAPAAPARRRVTVMTWAHDGADARR